MSSLYLLRSDAWNKAQEKSQEKRLFSRLPYTLGSKAILGGEFKIIDFSPGGIGLSSRTAFKKNDMIAFTPHLPGTASELPLSCKVIWSKKNKNSLDYLAGAHFIHPIATRDRLTKYLYSAMQHMEKTPITFTPIQAIAHSEDKPTLIKDIQTAILPPFFRELVDQCKRFSKRSDYTWKWCYKAMKLTTLSSVDPFFLQLLENTKLAGLMFSILVDDLADEKRDVVLLNDCIKMVLLQEDPDLTKISVEKRVEAKFLISLWNIIQNNLRQFPRYEEFKELIQYDFEQTVNTLKYAYLSNEMANLINEEEAFLFEGNNINVVIDAIMDVTCSPSFDSTELGKLREIAWHAQMMCKIANWIATWRREVAVGDWTSGVIASALKTGVLSHHDLCQENCADIIQKINNSSLEEQHMLQWEQHRSWILKYRDDIRSIDVNAYLNGIEKFYQVQVVSEGLS